MWYCVVGLVSGIEKNIVFNNEEAAYEFYSNINSHNDLSSFLRVGVTAINLNLNNVEWVAKPESFTDEWDKNKKL